VKVDATLKLSGQGRRRGGRVRTVRRRSGDAFLIAGTALLLLLPAVSLSAREHHRKVKASDYGLGFSTEIAYPEHDVLQAVQAVVNDGIIQGSKEYNKDKYIDGAHSAATSSLFPEWKEPGEVYYKVRTGVLAPLNFKESNDQGTLAVRYVVQSKDASKTILRIDAVFVEDFRRTVHPSDGSVESAESQDIEDHLDTLAAGKKQIKDEERKVQEKQAAEELKRKQQSEEASVLAASENSGRTLNQHLEELRHKAERVVKAPGGQLKSAPFHTATNVKTLDAGAEVVILVVTAYWYGVETTDGQHGWINRKQLEPLP
jgi:hypothetical protein